MINEILDGYFVNHARLPLEHKNRLYPTQASAYINKKTHKKLEGKCLRAAYYSCQGLPEQCNLTIENRLMSKSGDYLEKMILDTIKSEKVLVESGAKFSIEKYNIYGKLDGIVLVNDKEVGIEIKTVSSSKWITNQVWGSPWNKPYPKWQHLFQTLIYAYAFQERLQEFILFYIRRDTCEIKEFRISIIADGNVIYPVIDGIVDRRFSVTEILERYALLSRYVEKSETPPREYVKIYSIEQIPLLLKLGIISKKQSESYHSNPFGDQECKMCGYADLCYKED